MKILTSQTQLSGSQINSLASTELKQISIQQLRSQSGQETGQETGQAGSGGGTKVNEPQANDGSNTRSSRNSASITLSLTNKVLEEQGVATQSTVSITRDDGSSEVVNHHESLEIAKFAAEQSSELELTVTNAVPVSDSPIEIAAAINVEVVSVFTQTSSQNLTFEALGQVTTEDGRSIDFMLALDYERNISLEQMNRFAGNRNLIDPLMINLEGGAVELSDLTFEFDLNSDGVTEHISQTAGGSGFLVFDKNNNGEIDNGSEMFGPQSGKGYEELRQYDDDGNGWIDENDEIFSELGVMSFTAEGREGQSLLDAGVGAIFLGSVESNYELNTESGFYGGQITQSGIALAEDGRTLLVQEVQLQVRPEEEQINTSTMNINSVAVLRPGIELDAEESESPLDFFKFDDAIISNRNEETLVNIEFPVDSFQLMPQTGLQSNSPVQNANQESANSNSQALDLGLTAANAGQQIFDRVAVAQELSDWVANAMVDFQPETVSNDSPPQQLNTFFELEQVKPPVFDQALTEMDIDALKLESSLGTMRSMIETLRENRLQMEQFQSRSQPQMSIYQSVGRFKE